MNKICTSLEQSQKLIELGVDVNTADMWLAERYEGRVMDNGQYIVAEEPYYYLSLTKPSDTNYSLDTIKDIPAWSLSALLGLIPPGNILLRDALSEKYKCINTIDSDYYDNPVDAAFEMVCWLIGS